MEIYFFGNPQFYFFKEKYSASRDDTVLESSAQNRHAFLYRRKKERKKREIFTELCTIHLLRLARNVQAFSILQQSRHSIVAFEVTVNVYVCQLGTTKRIYRQYIHSYVVDINMRIYFTKQKDTFKNRRHTYIYIYNYQLVLVSVFTVLCLVKLCTRLCKTMINNCCQRCTREYLS